MVVLIILFGTHCTASAIDEAKSLGLLIRTIESAQNPNIQSALLRGMLRGLEGRRLVTAPDGWRKLSQRLSLSQNQEVRELSNELSQIFGDRVAIDKSLALLRDQQAAPGARRTALKTLLRLRNQEASQLLESLIDDSHLRVDAIRGFAMLENATGPSILLSRFDTFEAEHQRAVIETLATRKSYAEPLLTAVTRGSIAKDVIPAHVARSLKSLLGDRFVKVFGEVKEVAEDRERLMRKYRKMVTFEALTTADASRGRAVFKKTCASCHVLYGDGAKIGPDLTGSNRANLDYILLNSVDPSYDVPVGYRMVSIVTVEGRVLNGVIAEEDATRIVLKTVEQPRVVILKEDIEQRKLSSKSMMPEGQLDKMKHQEVIDLIKYLRTTEQVELPE